MDLLCLQIKMNTLVLRSRIDRLGEKGFVQPLLVLCVQGWIIGMDCQTNYFGGTILLSSFFLLSVIISESRSLKQVLFLINSEILACDHCPACDHCKKMQDKKPYCFLQN
jgi:hypothetical protein